MYVTSHLDTDGADEEAMNALPAGTTPISSAQMKMMVAYVMQNPHKKSAEELGDVSTPSLFSSKS